MNNIKWNLCFLCQKDKKEPLRSTDSGLNTLSENLTRLAESSQLKSPLLWIYQLQPSEPLLTILKENNAHYHHNCTSNFKTSTIDNAIRNSTNNEAASSRLKRKSSSQSFPAVCIFCDEKEKDLSKLSKKQKQSEKLHAAGEFHTGLYKPNVEHVNKLTHTWREMALFLGDVRLLNKLDTDVRANEILYHGKCQKKFEREYKTSKEIPKTEDIEQRYKKALALEKTIVILKEKAMDHPDIPVEVRHILELYNNNLEEEGLHDSLVSNITRFGEFILDHCHDFEIHKNSHNINAFILKDTYVKNTAPSFSFDSSMDFLKTLRKAIIPVREAIDKINVDFDKEFNQANSLPPELISVIGMILEDNASPYNALQSTLTIAGQIVYNYKKTSRKSSKNRQQTTSKQLAIRETPIISYASLKLYSATRSKDLLNWNHFLGMTASYNRVINVINTMASKTLKIYKRNDKVIPLNLKKGVMTIFTKDNFDKNSSSNDAKTHFHGTSLCAFQPLKSIGEGFDQEYYFDDDIEISDFSLPKSYTEIKETIGKCSEYSCPVPTVNTPDISDINSCIQHHRDLEYEWMNNVFKAESIGRKSWSSYHAQKKLSEVPPPCNRAIFPLLKDVVHTLDIQHHLINLAIDYTKALNPKQVTAIDCSDQPIYALSKINQWLFPKFAPPNYLPLFGALHIEKALLVANGNLVNGTGLSKFLSDNTIETIGLETASIDVNHIHKARYSVQLTVVAIYKCLKEAHASSQAEKDLFLWADDMAKASNMFKYWYLILNFQTEYLVFVRSIREGNFHLFINVLRSLVKWFFIFDQYNYARWISVHIQDLLNLPVICPEIYKEFCTGRFGIQTSNREFSRIHFDHAHEQANKIIKSIKGPVDFVNREDDNQQRRWEIAGPEVAEYLKSAEFKLKNRQNSHIMQPHHEDNESHEKMFLKDVQVIIERLLSVNPFKEESFIKIGTDTEFSSEVNHFVSLIPEVGQNQYDTFVEKRLIKCQLKISGTIKKNDFITPAKMSKISMKKDKSKFKETDFNLLRSAASLRPKLTEALFKTEFTGVPESLTKDRTMYHGNKSQALDIYEKSPSKIRNIEPDAYVVDLSAVIRSLASVTKAKSFNDFSSEIRIYIERLTAGCRRIDILTDSYFQMSLKAQTRNSRGTGQFFSFSGDTLIPKDFSSDFLNNCRNKEALNDFLVTEMLHHEFEGASLVISRGEHIFQNGNDNIQSELSPLEIGCKHEEADVKIILHTHNCIELGFKNILVKTGDTDIITLILAHFPYFSSPFQIEVDFSFGKRRRFYNVNKIASKMTPKQLQGLMFFYSFTGCDLTSSFFNLSKTAWWKLWLENDFITDTFIKLSWIPNRVDNEELKNLETFVCIAYSLKRTKFDSIDNLRYQTFLKSSENNLRKLPPSKDSLNLHVLRSAYTSGWIWGSILQGNIDIPSPLNWGWKINEKNEFIPLWIKTTTSPLSEYLFTCNCRDKCSRCKCINKKTSCLPYCKCQCSADISSES